jgi:preprotein translocase subunit SecD
MREEIHSGKSLRYSLKTCFKRVYGAVIRPGLAILLVSFVLLFVTKGAIRDFSVALCIGWVLGIVSATMIQHGLMSLLLGYQFPNKDLFLPLAQRRGGKRIKEETRWKSREI